MRNRLVHLVGEAPPTSMLTLTADTKAFENPYAAASRMAWALGKLITKMRRWSKPEPIEYLAVWERTRAGWPHLHVLLRGPFVPQRVVSRWWAVLAKSPIVWFTALPTNRTAARYVTKYLTKDPDPFNRGRALRASAGFLVEPMRPQGKRYCRLGKLRVYEGQAWDWLAGELAKQRLVQVEDSGAMLSAPWGMFDGHENIIWLRWERQRLAVANREKPPPPPVPLSDRGLWADRPPTESTIT